MPRKVLVILGLAAFCGFIVAMVRAQEGQPTPAPPPSLLGPSEPSRLADRLKSIRHSVSQEYADQQQSAPLQQSTPSQTAPNSAPFQPTPAAPASMVPMENDTFRPRAQVQTNPHVPPASGVKLNVNDGGAEPGLISPETGETTSQFENDLHSSRRTARLERPQPSPPSGLQPVVAPRTSITASRSIGAAIGQQNKDVSLVSSLPELRVYTIGPASVSIGKECVYTVKAENLGQGDVHDMDVHVLIPATAQLSAAEAAAGMAQRQAVENGAEKVIWSLGRLSAGTTQQLQIRLAPKQAAPIELVVDWAVRPEQSVARIEVLQPQLEMTVSGPSDMLFGESKVFVISLSNPGSGMAENVTVNLAPLSGQGVGDSTKIGNIGPGEKRDVEIEVTARDAGVMELRVHAAADGGLRAEAVEKIQIRRAQLQLALEGPELKYAGSAAQYRLLVTNAGDAIAQNVVARVTLPLGAKLIGVSEAQTENGRLTWQLGNMAPGAERAIAVPCELTRPGENQFVANIESASGVAATQGIVTKVEALADLKLTVEDPKGPHPVGQDVLYQIRIVNRGTKAAENVNITAQFSEGIEPVAVEGQEANLVPGQAVFKPVVRIEPGQEITLKVSARPEAEGNHLFRMEVKCEAPETRLVSEGTTRFFGQSRTARSGESSIR